MPTHFFFFSFSLPSLYSLYFFPVLWGIIWLSRWHRISRCNSQHSCLIRIASRPVLGPTQPPMQRVPRAFFPGGGGVIQPRREAVHSLHLVARLRMHEAVPPLPHSSSWRNISSKTGAIMLLLLPLPVLLSIDLRHILE
jgi:hypothetical protein